MVIIWLGGGGGWVLHSATAPPNARLNPQLPIAVAATAAAHRNCAAGWLLPLLSPIEIALLAAPAHCRTHADAAAHCRTHDSLLPTAACTLAACHFCNHSPGHRRLLPHTCMLLAAAPMPLLLHTAARMPLPQLLLHSLPPPPLLVPRPLIA